MQSVGGSPCSSGGWVEISSILLYIKQGICVQRAPIAQVVEQLPFKETVPGSNPGGGTVFSIETIYSSGMPGMYCPKLESGEKARRSL